MICQFIVKLTPSLTRFNSIIATLRLLCNLLCIFLYSTECIIIRDRKDIKNSKAARADHRWQVSISRKDLLRGTMGGNDIEKTPVSVIMTRKPNITICYPNDLLIYAANQLIEKQIDSLPVVEERDGIDQVIGRITKTTITRVFVNLME